MKRVTVSGQLALVFVIVALVGAWGWISNIIKLASMDFGGVTGMLVLRAIGVFVAPLGAVLGFL